MGTVEVTASDDGINASGNAELQALIAGSEYVDDGRDEFVDTGERLEIAGGSVTVDAEGDGLDSNGSLTISGGTIVIHGPTAGGNGSLDADGEITVDGGTLTAFGPGSMEQTPGAGGQGWVIVSARVTAGQSGTIVDESGNTLAEFTARKDASTIIHSSSEVVAGTTDTVIVDGQTLGSGVAGEGGASGMPGMNPGQGAEPPTGPGSRGGQPGGPGQQRPPGWGVTQG